MDLAHLREATAAAHDRTEAAIPLLTAKLTLTEYARVLSRMYGFVRGWELWAAEHVPDDLRTELEARQRSGLLVRDLGFLSEAVPEVTATLATGEKISRAGFLGRMYVMEGSTLGGQYLAVEMERRVGLRHGEGNAYFAGYAAQTGSMWNAFKGLLLNVPDADADVLIAAAKTMFAAFEQWMTVGGGDGAPRKEQDSTNNA